MPVRSPPGLSWALRGSAKADRSRREAMDRVMGSPDGRSFTEGTLHEISILTAKSLVELWKVGQGSVDAEFRRAVGIGNGSEAQGLLAGEGAPSLGIAQEEPLSRGETLDLSARPTLGCLA